MIKCALLVGLSALVSATRISAQNETPGLELLRSEGGRLRLSPNGDASRAVLEQSDSLQPPIVWGPARITSAGTVDASAPVRVFRIRLLPIPPAPASSHRLGALAFQEAPPRIESGEAVQFVVTGTAGTPVDARWSVDGEAGGSSKNGFIGVLGRFTAPPTTVARTVTILAEVTASNGDRSQAQTRIEILPPMPPRQTALILAETGGVVESSDGRATIEIFSGALAQDTTIRITPVSPEEIAAGNAEDARLQDVLAQVELLPAGTMFATPAVVRLTLDRLLEPGTTLPLEILRDLPNGPVWEDAGLVGTVAGDGVTFVFSTPHFTVLRVVNKLAGNPIPAAPVVTEVLPATLLEGELRPLLLRGTGLDRFTRVTAHERGSLAVTPSLIVRQTAYDPGAPGELGVLLKSVPDPTLPVGQSRVYTLRLRPWVGPPALVNITVTGLDEWVLGAGETRKLSNPPTNQMLFSKIEIGSGAIVEFDGRLLAWQATDRAFFEGEIRAIGKRGLDGTGVLGGGFIGSPPSGAGEGATLGTSVTTGDVPLVRRFPTHGIPTLEPDLTQFLPGTMNRLFGQAGAMGFDPGSGGYDDVLSTVSEAMYARYTAEVIARLPGRDPFDFNFWRVLAEELTQEHPEGRKGHQGVPGGFVPRVPRAGTYFPLARTIESGGGGGGGGASYRLSGEQPGTFDDRAGLGGGSGGGGGSAVSLVAGGELRVAATTVVNVSGGDGGHGSGPRVEDFPSRNYTDTAIAGFGRGGGGGPGGAGTIHLLAGERLTRQGSPSLFNTAGTWGLGGFLMVANTHRQASPPTWLEPGDELPARSTAEISGPDFSAIGGLRTGIQTGRAIEARALNPYDQNSTVMVHSRAGQRSFRLRGTGASTRKIRLLLQPGTNVVAVSSLDDHAVLNRQIVVLNTPDTDGDGLSDAEEQVLGYNPSLPDTDADGISDAEEWLVGGNGIPGDSDSDGFPDSIEDTAGSDSHDPNSTPLNTPGTMGPAQIMADSVRAIRPAFGAANGVAPSLVIADPRETRVVRPAIGTAFGVPMGLTVGTPQTVRVQRQ